MTQASKSRRTPPVHDLTEAEKQNRKATATNEAPAGKRPVKKSGPRKESPAGPVKTARKKKNP